MMGVPLLLLPGMMCDHRLFRAQIEAFENGRMLQVPLSTQHDNLPDMASSILAGAPPRFALGGVSMGGILAMELMRQAPDRISHLALMNTNPFAEKLQMKARREPQMKAVKQGRLEQVMREEMKPNYFTRTAGSADDGDSKDNCDINGDSDSDGDGGGVALLDLCMEMALDLGPDAFLLQSLALRDRPDYAETLRQVACPSLILCGRHDQLCPVERHLAMAEMIPHARLVIIEEAGHLPTIETPDRVTAAITDLLETNHG